MSERDDRIIAANEEAQADLEHLHFLRRREESARAGVKLTCKKLLAAGLSSRFVGEAIGVSHVTILNWTEEVDN